MLDRYAICTYWYSGEWGNSIDVSFNADEDFIKYLSSHIENLLALVYEPHAFFIEEEKRALQDSYYYACDDVERTFDLRFVDISALPTREEKIVALLNAYVSHAESEHSLTAHTDDTSAERIAALVQQFEIEQEKLIHAEEVVNKIAPVGSLCYIPKRGKAPVKRQKHDEIMDCVPAELVDVDSIKHRVAFYPAPNLYQGKEWFTDRSGKKKKNLWWGRLDDEPSSELWAETPDEVLLGFAIRETHRELWEDKTSKYIPIL